MKKAILPLLFSIIAGLFANGQPLPFTKITADLEKLGFSNAAWGDYDNDGDLDFAVAGEPGNTIPETKIYRNDAGTFTDIHAVVKGLTYSSLEWGDFDNDADLDLLVSGYDSAGNPGTKIFRNNAGIFSDNLSVLPAVAEGAASWGDFDNDNDLDILVVGSMTAKILRNDGNGIFTDINAGLTPVQNAFCSWADYNNDGWLDALIGGDLGGTYITELYKNVHGVFVEDPVGFMSLAAACARWADLDNDGDKDLVLAGMDPNLTGNLLMYKNKGNGQFDLIDNYTTNLLNPNFDLGDYDNDGYLDMILIGRIAGCGGTALTLLYHNDKSFVFSDILTQIHGFRQGSASWGDYNNDGYADILFTGFDEYSEHQTEIYINNAGSGAISTNTPPSVPAGLQAAVSGDAVQLTWHAASDEQTAASGLSYNIAIGTSENTGNILSPSSDLPSGFRQLAKIGNTNKDTTWTVQDLEPGTYYWSVQSVDNGFLASGFAAAGMFVIDPVGISDLNKKQIEVYPNPTDGKIFLKGIVHPSALVEVYDPQGKLVYQSYGLHGEIDLSGAGPGVYVLKVTTKDKVTEQTLIRK